MSQLKNSWNRIKSVCNNPNDTRYYRYGGRGIRCEWNNFDEFVEDMRESYDEHLRQHGRLNTTIERKDNNGNYCKENCKWATRQEQAANRVSRREITFNGKTQSLKEWGDEVGIPDYAILMRINRRGWTIEEALTIPLIRKGSTFKKNGGLFKKGHKPFNK